MTLKNIINPKPIPPIFKKCSPLTSGFDTIYIYLQSKFGGLLLYKAVIRKFLFLFDAEQAHHLSVGLMRFVFNIPGVKVLFRKLFLVKDKGLERKLFGITFPNPVGLAAGFDKNAEYLHYLKHMGFGFVEIGTVTPRPQVGNDKPRLFRLRQDEAVINRMGFNNDGVNMAVKKLKNRPEGLVIGGNIGKNKSTPNDEAINDYLRCYDELHDYVDYFVVNVSSPNTPNLRDLQEKEPLRELLNTLMQHNADQKDVKPILLKIAPDLSIEQLDDVIEIALDVPIDGIIATNTTVSRDGLLTDWKIVNDIGAGGLSGKPVKRKSTETIRYIHKKTNGKMPIIGVGGILSPEDAKEKLHAGASLVQLYTGFVYEGPSLIKNINKAILEDK